MLAGYGPMRHTSTGMHSHSLPATWIVGLMLQDYSHACDRSCHTVMLHARGCTSHLQVSSLQGCQAGLPSGRSAACLPRLARMRRSWMAKLSIMMPLFHSHSSVLLSTSVQTMTSGCPLVAAQHCPHQDKGLGHV